MVYSRNRNGSLSISFDSHGGHMDADLSGSKQGREDIYEMVSNGLIDTMSFGFTIADDGWEWTEDEDGVIHTRITKISKLFDVSVISGFPANPGTEVSARSLYDAAIEARSKMAQAADEAAQEAARAAEEAEREQQEEQERIAAQAASQRRKRMAAALRLASM
jgi:HK97 family phage prohead protease